MSGVDPITLGVIWGALQSITVEVGTTVHRTAHSQQAREGQDFSVCLFDPEGRMVAQGPYSPGHMGAMAFAARNAIAAFPAESLRAGDVVLFNSPFLGSGHFPDFFMIQPAFQEDGRLIGFAANILHHTDVGGMRPGSQAVEGVTDYFQEGLHIPPVKLWKSGQEQDGILAVILANTRMPESMRGDLHAQRNSLRVGELRLMELAERHGYDAVQAAMTEIMGRTEAKVREAIRAIPDGVYPFEDFMDDYGPRTPPMRLVVTVTVGGDEIRIDFDGTGPQTESGMNSYLNYTRSYCYAAVKCLTDPHGPQNDGAFRPVRIEAPAGSFLNPRPPAGGGPRAVFCYRLFDAVIGALAPALPGRVTAAGSHFANPTFGGFDPRRNRRTVVYELVLSGTAARPDRDGVEAMAMAFNASNIPVESQEASQPVLVERFELRRDSAGAGRYRGGTGIRRDLRLLLRNGQLTNNTERQRFAPWGLFGGQPGQPGVTLLNPGTPRERRLHSKASDTFEYGDVVSFQQPGAGGYGPPGERDPQAVLRDVIEDYVSIEGARRDYGVVIDPVTLTVDEAATRTARAAMRAQAPEPPPVVTRQGPLW
ncbi:MAG TPA: hydantoinase B/oxoprolinase family protein [Methylomirabilota bacterium]|jgi:N-methylhydantoinase B|nr:hydantoinase B/oxoprolinase family protein [Methylomirabilota bacterium]